MDLDITNMDIDSLRAAITKLAGAIRDLKKSGPSADVAPAVAKLVDWRKKLEEMEITESTGKFAVTS